jgi:hypothetical protein
LYQRDFSGPLVPAVYTNIQHLGAGLFSLQKEKGDASGLIAVRGSCCGDWSRELLPFRFSNFVWKERDRILHAFVGDSLYRYHFDSDRLSLFLIEKKIATATESIVAKNNYSRKPNSYPVIESEDNNDFAAETDSNRLGIEQKPHRYIVYFDKGIEIQFQKYCPKPGCIEQLISRLQKQKNNEDAFPYKMLKEDDFQYILTSWKKFRRLLVLPSGAEIEAVFADDQLAVTYKGSKIIYKALFEYFTPLFILQENDKPIHVSNLNLISNKAFFTKK